MPILFNRRTPIYGATSSPRMWRYNLYNYDLSIAQRLMSDASCWPPCVSCDRMLGASRSEHTKNAVARPQSTSPTVNRLATPILRLISFHTVVNEYTNWTSVGAASLEVAARASTVQLSKRQQVELYCSRNNLNGRDNMSPKHSIRDVKFKNT
jgi:hypothetical protein